MARTLDGTERTVRLDDGCCAGVWRFDPELSSVRFRVGFLWGLMPIRGGFGRFRGQVLVDARLPRIGSRPPPTLRSTGHGSA